MNPDTGKLHKLMTDEESKAFKEQFTKSLSPKMKELIDRSNSIKRLAEDVPEAELEKGDPLPGSWPVFTEGQELRQIKGWKLVVDSIDTEAQRITVRLERR
jgi:hypothetical protein